MTVYRCRTGLSLAAILAAASLPWLSGCNNSAKPPSANATIEKTVASDPSLPEPLRDVPKDAAEHLVRTSSGELLTDLYKDITTECGIDHTFHNGQEAGHYAILESLGGGAGLIDFDGDGLLD